jgi:RimJ/RimL family protein N-acetyltransferase
VTIIVETDRLRLSPWLFEDFEIMHGLTVDDRMRTFLGPTPSSREDSFNRLMRSAGCWHYFGWGPFKAVDKNSGEVVGGLGLFRAMRDLGSDFDPFPEAGWTVRAQHWGTGFATEGMRAILDWFDREHGGRTVCIISPGHTASERIAEKLGYRPIGLADYKDEPVMRFARDPA